MTRDAKIGLLLGLLFIFVIAFIINGLPSLGRSDGNELTRNMARPQRKPGIGTEGRQVAQRTITPVRPVVPPAQPQQVEPQVSQQTQSNVRFETQIPQTAVQTSQPIGQIQMLTQQNQPVQQTQSTQQISADLQAIASQINAIEVQQNTTPAVISPAAPKPARAHIYTVEDGDSLASIAKEFYGSEQGNKKANVDLIFKANSKILKSPDSIYVGQKLIIPPLPDSVLNSPKTVAGNENFRPVQSVGTNHENQAAKNRNTKYYVVKDGDSLWKIAAEQLGDGNKYKELAKINKLKDEDFLVVGAKLMLP
ncbi:MAG: LysM peptidoglycan-binding domain-containing protein [Phycisphaerae bacterium]|jgi:LysM repeat protein